LIAINNRAVAAASVPASTLDFQQQAASMVAVSQQQLQQQEQQQLQQQQQQQQQHRCNNHMNNEQLQRRPHLRSRDKVIGLLCQKVFGV